MTDPHRIIEQAEQARLAEQAKLYYDLQFDESDWLALDPVTRRLRPAHEIDTGDGLNAAAPDKSGDNTAKGQTDAQVGGDTC